MKYDQVKLQWEYGYFLTVWLTKHAKTTVVSIDDYF